jgi:hypothetical protein
LGVYLLGLLRVDVLKDVVNRKGHYFLAVCSDYQVLAVLGKYRGSDWEGVLVAEDFGQVSVGADIVEVLRGGRAPFELAIGVGLFLFVCGGLVL